MWSFSLLSFSPELMEVTHSTRNNRKGRMTYSQIFRRRILYPIRKKGSLQISRRLSFWGNSITDKWTFFSQISSYFTKSGTRKETFQKSDSELVDRLTDPGPKEGGNERAILVPFFLFPSEPRTAPVFPVWNKKRKRGENGGGIFPFLGWRGRLFGAFFSSLWAYCFASRYVDMRRKGWPDPSWK